MNDLTRMIQQAIRTEIANNDKTASTVYKYATVTAKTGSSLSVILDGYTTSVTVVCSCLCEVGDRVIVMVHGHEAIAISRIGAGALPIGLGGTGLTSVGTGALYGNGSTNNYGELPIAYGGTGAKTAAAARTNIGTPSAILDSTGYWGLGNPDGTHDNTVFIRTPAGGIIPATSTVEGDSYVGTPSWPFYASFFKNINGHAVYSWVQVATWSNNATKSFTNLSTSGYNEIMVVLYRSSVPEFMTATLPVAMLTTSYRQLYLTGGLCNSGSGTGREVIIKISFTSALAWIVSADSVDVSGSGCTWYLFAR